MILHYGMFSIAFHGASHSLFLLVRLTDRLANKYFVDRKEPKPAAGDLNGFITGKETADKALDR
jgi:hypothetical protein